jgi:hypothetical protein
VTSTICATFSPPLRLRELDYDSSFAGFDDKRGPSRPADHFRHQDAALFSAAATAAATLGNDHRSRRILSRSVIASAAEAGNLR